MDIFSEIRLYMREHPSQRVGQAHFNVVAERHPEIAKEVQGTELDPFYDSDKTGAFMSHVLTKIEG